MSLVKADISHVRNESSQSKPDKPYITFTLPLVRLDMPQSESAKPLGRLDMSLIKPDLPQIRHDKPLRRVDMRQSKLHKAFLILKMSFRRHRIRL